MTHSDCSAQCTSRTLTFSRRRDWRSPRTKFISGALIWRRWLWGKSAGCRFFRRTSGRGPRAFISPTTANTSPPLAPYCEPSSPSYVASEPAELVFRYSEKDKPSLALAGNRVEFNVSHSGTRALLAFARGRALGVDVEKIREDLDPDALAHRFFSSEEQSQLAALPTSEKFHGFFRCWTRKEAFIKAKGAGLSLPLDQFDVSLRPGEENALLATRPDRSRGRTLVPARRASRGWLCRCALRSRPGMATEVVAGVPAKPAAANRVPQKKCFSDCATLCTQAAPKSRLRLKKRCFAFILINLQYNRLSPLRHGTCE